MTLGTAMHETRHILAAGCALVYLDVRKIIYDKVRIHVDVDGQTGETGLHPEGLHDQTRLRAMALAAAGPLASIPDAWLGLAKGLDLRVEMKKVARAAQLSPDDLRLIESWDGPSTGLAAIVRAVQLIEGDLGLGRMTKLARVVADPALRTLDQPMLLSTYIPWHRAEQALKRARTDLVKREDAA